MSEILPKWFELLWSGVVMRASKGLPPLHLWVYNHPMTGISDQIEFFFLIMRQHGYPVSMSRKPREDALNVVIENFSDMTSNALIDFCKQSAKRVALIMTEHLDLTRGRIFIHGEPLWSNNDYMHPATQVDRIKNLMDCVPYLRSIIVLGDLPQLEGAERMFPGLPVRTLPFPALLEVDVADQTPKYELVFSGALTAFREYVLRRVAESYTLEVPARFLSRKGRDRLNATASVILNIPQRPNWRWLSLMRIIAALRCGRATVSIGTGDTSCIGRCCIQLKEQEWESHIGGILSNWTGAYQVAYQQYESMRNDFLKERGFPADLFEYWALLEGV